MGRPRRGEEKLPPDNELPALLKTHGSYMALARLFDCSKSSVAARCRKLGLKSPDRRSGRRYCAMCGRTSEEAAVHRFQLHVSRASPGWPEGRHAGSLDLCHQCWRNARNAPRPKRSVTRALTVVR